MDSQSMFCSYSCCAYDERWAVTPRVGHACDLRSPRPMDCHYIGIRRNPISSYSRPKNLERFGILCTALPAPEGGQMHHRIIVKITFLLRYLTLVGPKCSPFSLEKACDITEGGWSKLSSCGRRLISQDHSNVSESRVASLGCCLMILMKLIATWNHDRVNLSWIWYKTFQKVDQRDRIHYLGVFKVPKEDVSFIDPKNLTSRCLILSRIKPGLSCTVCGRRTRRRCTRCTR